MSWEKANYHCRFKENGMLACFDNKEEARILAEHCHDVNDGYANGDGDDKPLRAGVSLLLKPYLRWLGVWTT